MRNKIVGSGITQRTTVSFNPNTETEEVINYLRREFCDREFSFEGLQGHPIEKLARGILEKAGLAEPGADLFDLAALPIGDNDPDSLEGYAVRFSRELHCIRTLVSRGEKTAQDVARQACFDLGALYTEARMKFQHEANALLGEDIRERRRKGGRAAAKKIKAQKAKLHRKIRFDATVLAYDHEPPEIHGKLANKYSLTSRQIRNILNKKSGNVA